MLIRSIAKSCSTKRNFQIMNP